MSNKQSLGSIKFDADPDQHWKKIDPDPGNFLRFTKFF